MRRLPMSVFALLLLASVAPAQPPLTIDSATQPAVNLRRTVTVQVVAQTKNAVVNISATKLVDKPVNPMGFNPFFDGFQMGQTVKVPADSLGSGFIVQRDGYVVTNNHVVDRARQISVELSDGRKLPAELISADADADLAVLRIKSDKPLPVLPMGDSDDLLIGEPVIAVGNPLGFNHSVSTGIVSALHRDINPQLDDARKTQRPAPVKGEQAALHDLIQTDAAINPGNSGGPLLNAYGQVIGINTAIRGDAQNIGFAIPIDRLRDLVADLMNPAQVTHVEVPIKLLEKRTVSEPSTVHVKIVSPTKPGLTLDTIDGVRPVDVVDAYAMLLRARAGQAIHFTWSDGSSQTVTPSATPTPDAIVRARQKLGIGIEQNTPMLADRLNLAQEDGLYVSTVAQGSVAARTGITPGDLIVQLGRYPVPTLDALARLLPHLPDKGSVHIGVVRGKELAFGLLEF